VAAGRRHRRGPEELGGGGAPIEWLWLAGDTARVRAEGGRLLEVAVRAQHPYLRAGDAALPAPGRRAGRAVPGLPDPVRAGIEGDWATAAELWERAGNPYEQALELTEAPDPEPARAGLAMLDRLGAAPRPDCAGAGCGGPAYRCRAGPGRRPGRTRAG
jgi:hypothetical protein